MFTRLERRSHDPSGFNEPFLFTHTDLPFETSIHSSLTNKSLLQILIECSLLKCSHVIHTDTLSRRCNVHPDLMFPSPSAINCFCQTCAHMHHKYTVATFVNVPCTNYPYATSPTVHGQTAIALKMHTNLSASNPHKSA